MATVKKIVKASSSYGRGMDNYREPGRYGVFNKHGKQVAWITSRRIRYMDKAEWKVGWMEGHTYKDKYFTFGGFRAAKAWAEENF